MTAPERRILVLGGTSWLGGECARTARARGHDVTCLARGESGAAPDGIRLVSADRWRPGAYDEVATGVWDAVIDVSRQPEQVRSALAALTPFARHWIYVSSVSVYRDHSEGGSDAVHEPWAGTGEAAAEEYGAAKVACEESCTAALSADRLLVARAGLIAGYGDRSDRFGYWPGRVARARATERVVLSPPAHTPVQVIDVRDLAGWLVTAAENGTAGTYDTVGDLLGIDDLLRACAEVAGTDPEFVSAEQRWLLAHGVEPWAGPESLPLWLPLPAYARMTAHDNAAAVGAGLALRPLLDTVRSALTWERELGLDRERAAGLSSAREAALVTELLGHPSG